jgi:hypothetical protein
MRVGKYIGVLILAFSLYWGISSPTHAGLILGTVNDWDPHPGAGAWSNTYGWAAVDTPTSGGNTGGWLSVTFTNTSPGPDVTWVDIIQTQATNLYAGTFSTSMWFAFDFWASNVIPNGLQVRWQSATNDYIWGNVVSLPSETNEWQTLRSSTLLNWDDWDIDGFASEEQFLADLGSIEWIGIFIDRNTALQQIYGVDNVMLMIPEPCEWALLLCSCLAIWMAQKRRLSIIPVSRGSPTAV